MRLFRLLIFDLHLLLECSLAGDEDVELVGEVTAVERFGQVIEQYLSDDPLEFFAAMGAAAPALLALGPAAMMPDISFRY